MGILRNTYLHFLQRRRAVVQWPFRRVPQWCSGCSPPTPSATPPPNSPPQGLESGHLRTFHPRPCVPLQCRKLLPNSPHTATMSLSPPSCPSRRIAKLKTHRRSSAVRSSHAENTVSENSRYRPLTDIISLTCSILSGAIFISTHSDRGILKVPWSKPYIQLGRGPYTLGNDVILPEKRVSNTHCRFTLGMQNAKNLEPSNDTARAWKEGEGEPEVWVEDLKSSNGTFVGCS